MSQPGVRSLNLSVSAAIGLFEARRQLGYLS
jgi:tRNA (cytidine/uridine-2'-O-)-methyltransferase